MERAESGEGRGRGRGKGGSDQSQSKTALLGSIIVRQTCYTDGVKSFYLRVTSTRLQTFLVIRCCYVSLNIFLRFSVWLTLLSLQTADYLLGLSLSSEVSTLNEPHPLRAGALPSKEEIAKPTSHVLIVTPTCADYWICPSCSHIWIL